MRKGLENGEACGETMWHLLLDGKRVIVGQSNIPDMDIGST